MAPSRKSLTLSTVDFDEGRTVKFPSALHSVSPEALFSAPLDVRNFVGGMDALFGQPVSVEKAGQFGDFWTVYQTSYYTTLDAHGSPVPVAAIVHDVFESGTGAAQHYAKRLGREAWVRTHILNKITYPAIVPHWFGVFAGMGNKEGGPSVPVFAAVVGAHRPVAPGHHSPHHAVLSPTRGHAVLRAYHKLHSLGVVHGRPEPANWMINHENDMCIVDFGHALIRRGAATDVPAILEEFGCVLDDKEFEGAALAELLKVGSILKL